MLFHEATSIAEDDGLLTTLALPSADGEVVARDSANEYLALEHDGQISGTLSITGGNPYSIMTISTDGKKIAYVVAGYTDKPVAKLHAASGELMYKLEFADDDRRTALVTNEDKENIGCISNVDGKISFSQEDTAADIAQRQWSISASSVSDGGFTRYDVEDSEQRVIWTVSRTESLEWIASPALAHQKGDEEKYPPGLFLLSLICCQEH